MTYSSLYSLWFWAKLMKKFKFHVCIYIYLKFQAILCKYYKQCLWTPISISLASNLRPPNTIVGSQRINTKHSWQDENLPFHWSLWKWDQSRFLQINGWCSEKSVTTVEIYFRSTFVLAALCARQRYVDDRTLTFSHCGWHNLLLSERSLKGTNGILSILGKPEKYAGRYPICGWRRKITGLFRLWKRHEFSLRVIIVYMSAAGPSSVLLLCCIYSTLLRFCFAFVCVGFLVLRMWEAKVNSFSFIILQYPFVMGNCYTTWHQ